VAGNGLRGKRRYRYRKKLLRRQEIMLARLQSFPARVLIARASGDFRQERTIANQLRDLRQEARELAGRMVHHGLSVQCRLLEYVVEEVMEE